MERKVIAQLILNLGTKCMCVVCFTTQLLYTKKRSPHVPTELLAGLASEPFWVMWKRKNLVPSQE